VNRTFYGPHLKAPGCAPALARARPATLGNGNALARKPRQAGGPGPRWSNPEPDILWSAPGSAEMRANIGRGKASHPTEWPRTGPEAPGMRAAKDHGGRTQAGWRTSRPIETGFDPSAPKKRTFYGPHPTPRRPASALNSEGVCQEFWTPEALFVLAGFRPHKVLESIQGYLCVPVTRHGERWVEIQR